MSVFHIAKIVLRSLFSKPATGMYPFKKREYYLSTRGSIQNDIESCIFCGLCSKKCPANAIEVSRNDKQWSIDRFRCVTCNACVEACPKKCLVMKNTYTAPATIKSVDKFTKSAESQQ
ncbi:MAG: 4Fe-4S dicluster domain-containing protein [Bacillota bacterium]|nr:4Fe-4S dicluster domain-containing protein [Bacillota bacterium]